MHKPLAVNIIVFCFYLCSAEIPIHIFSFHKDEVDMLELWTQHHLKIVQSASRIHIIDHNSSNIDVKKHLEILKSRGYDIINFLGAFSEKAKILSQFMRKYTSTPAFLVPLDIDEFIVSVTPSKQYSINYREIFTAFQLLPKLGKFKFAQFDAFFCNRTGGASSALASNSKPLIIRNFGYIPLSCVSKTFFYSGDFLMTDQGNHRGFVSSRCDPSTTDSYHDTCNDCFQSDTKLAIIHYGGEASFTFEEYTEKMLLRAAEYNYSDMKYHWQCKKVLQGRHYCNFVVKRLAWTQRAMEKQFKNRVKCTNRTFVNDELRNALGKL